MRWTKTLRGHVYLGPLLCIQIGTVALFVIHGGCILKAGGLEFGRVRT
jgi:hypothetical protein